MAHSCSPCDTSRVHNPLPLEAVVTDPLPGMALPGELAFSPDDRLITFLFSPDRSLTRALFALDPATGERRALALPAGGGATEDNISLEEKLRRERARQRELGITQYFWATSRPRILVPLRGALHVMDGPDAPLRPLVEGGPPALVPALSPDGNWVAYVQDAELFVVPFAGGAPRMLTRGARGTGKTNGLAEYVAQEEMRRREGFWWSPDSRQIAFTEVDETHIAVYRIVHQGKDRPGGEAQEDHRYPFAGEPNARVRLGVVARDGGEPVWMDLGADEDIYVARVEWMPDGRLTAQIQDRRQSSLELWQFDPQTGARVRLLVREASDVWVNLHDLFWPLERADGAYAGGFLWASERTGFQHLYLHDREGALIRPLTAGEWMVDAIAGVDEERAIVYFLGTREGATEKHLYAVSLEGGEPRRLTAAPGMHQVIMDHGCRRFLDVHDGLESPPSIALCRAEDGARLLSIHEERDPRIDALGLTPPEIVSLESRDGVTLHGALYRPPAHFGPGPHPTIVQVYGGPHVQRVTRGWAATTYMRAQHLRSLGFVVFVLDNRGSARRGLAFEGAVKHDLGRVEVDDQVDGVRWLVAQGLADPARVGIYGWSYGGYLSAMALCRAPETFKVAVAGAPVTHWDGYDTHYTERYMGLPAENARGYAESSVMHHVEALQGKLLLVHGLIDENVHFRHTARLINALIRAKKPYDLLLFPDERHMPRARADRIYMEERIRAYFVANI